VILNYFFICLIPARKRKDKAIIRAIAIISRGVIIKNDPPELIPKIENKTAYPITKAARIIAEKIIKIPSSFDFCINIIYLNIYLDYFLSRS
jgi:hypothetical protein